MCKILIDIKFAFSFLLINFITACLYPCSAEAQTVIGGSVPDPSAMLDVQSDSKGVLFPRILDRSLISSPANGLMIFNLGVGCLEINFGTPENPQWQTINCRCGAFVASGVWKEFMCHNLGAANFAADPFTPSWEIIGGYWQWGKKTAAAPGPTGINGNTPNEGTPDTWTPPGDDPWSNMDAVNGSWSESNKTHQDPCPDGFRVPTVAQLVGVLNNSLNPKTVIGNTWTAGPLNYSNGIRFGNFLFLPAAGRRNPTSGALEARGASGFYWSSKEAPTATLASSILFNDALGSGNNVSRRFGLSVRCIAE